MLAAPADDVGAIDLVGGELGLDLGGDPPTTGSAVAAATAETIARPLGDPGLRIAVLEARRSLLDDHAGDDLGRRIGWPRREINRSRERARRFAHADPRYHGG